jgi:ABC-2 type transport system permease protein
MKRLLSIELQKIWLNKASRVLILSYFIILSFIALIASIEVDIMGFHFKIADQGIFNFPYIWHFNTFVAVMLKIFLAIVIVSMTTNEYTYGTLKQNLIDGLSKKEFIQSKALTVGVFSLASTIFVTLMTLILGYSFSAFTEPSIVFSEMSFLLGYFINLVTFFSFCLFAGILIKRSAFALGFIFLWFVAEGIIYSILRSLFGDEVSRNIIAFFPLEAISNVLIEPISRFDAIQALGNQVDANNPIFKKDYYLHWYQAAIALFWTGFFLFMSFRILKRRDL